MTLTVVPTRTTMAVNSAVLKAAYAELKSLLPSGNYGPPVLKCVRFDATPDGVRLTATNIDDTLSTTVAGVCTESGSVLVPAALLNKLLTAAGKGTVEILGPTVEAEPTLRCNNVSLSYPPYELDEWPRFEPGPGRTIELNLNAIADVMPAVSDDESRPILCAVYVNKGSYAATDSYRNHVVDTPVDTGEGFLMNRSGALVAAKYKGKVTATVHERDVTVQLDEHTTLRTRLVQGTFPQIRSLIPVNPQCKLVLSDRFVADVKTLGKVIAGDLTIRPNGGELTLSAKRDDIRTTVTTPGSTDLDAVGFNPKYLTDLLTGTTSNLLMMTDNRKPGVLREPAPQFGEDAQRIRLIMPVRPDSLCS